MERKEYIYLQTISLVLQEKEDEAMYQKGYRKLICELFPIVEMNRENGIVMKLLSLIQMNPLFLFVNKESMNLYYHRNSHHLMYLLEVQHDMLDKYCATTEFTHSDLLV